jgi:hypothetical protein
MEGKPEKLQRIAAYANIGSFLIAFIMVLPFILQMRQHEEPKRGTKPSVLIPSADNPKGDQAGQQQSSTEPTPQQPSGNPWFADRKELITYVLPPVLVIILLIAAIINIIAVRAANRKPLKGDNDARNASEVEIAPGTKVRVISSIDKNKSPGWHPAMNQYIGQEYVVDSITEKGWVRLKGIPDFFLSDWVQPISKKSTPSAKWR